MFKKIFTLLFVFFLSFLIVSCQNQKTTKNTSNKINNSVNNNSSDNISTTTKDILTEKEKQSGRFEKIKDSKNIKTTESKIEAGEIKNPNISPNGGGTPTGGVDTGANPLDL